MKQKFGSLKPRIKWIGFDIKETCDSGSFVDEFFKKMSVHIYST